MAHNAQKYRYGNLVVEVCRLEEKAGGKSKYKCLVRGYGHNNKEPRGTYEVETETTAKASRIALDLYKRENDGRS